MFQYIGGRGLCKSFLVLTILQKMRRPENYQGTVTFLPICGTLSVQKDLFHKAKEHIQDGKELSLLRRCGHFLHHSAGTEDTASLLNALTTEERATLEGLLEKCLAHWEKH